MATAPISGSSRERRNDFSVIVFVEIAESIKELAEAGQTGRYGPEALCANWSPQVTVLTEPTGVGDEEFADQSGLDAASFLCRFYRSQCA